MTVRLTPLLLASLLAVTISAQQPDRSAPPRPGAAPAFTPPPIVTRTLTNGLPVWIVERHKVPTVDITLVVRAGGGADPAGQFGLASLTADMLDEGAGTRDALQIADATDYLGATLATLATFDASTVELHVPVARLADALPIMADVALRPTFPAAEIERRRDELVASLVQAEDDPEDLVRFAFPRLVFGGHRYGTLTVGTAASVARLTAADLRRFHTRHYVPPAAALIVAGDVTPARLLPMLEAQFGAWKGAATPAAAVPTAPPLKTRQIFLVDKPGAAQSQIRIGAVGVPRSTPDYDAIRVLNTILGGSFTARLNTNLREEHGYAYGASSTFDMRASAGPFFAAAAVQTDKTAEALTEFFKELNGIRTPIPAGELEKAKNYLALQMPRSFETIDAIAGALTSMFVYGLPDDYYATSTARIRAVTAADVRRAAERYIQPDTFAIVVVGDRKAVEPGITGLHLGALKLVTTGEVMK